MEDHPYGSLMILLLFHKRKGSLLYKSDTYNHAMHFSCLGVRSKVKKNRVLFLMRIVRKLLGKKYNASFSLSTTGRGADLRLSTNS